MALSPVLYSSNVVIATNWLTLHFGSSVKHLQQDEELDSQKEAQLIPWSLLALTHHTILLTSLIHNISSQSSLYVITPLLHKSTNASQVSLQVVLFTSKSFCLSSNAKYHTHERFNALKDSTL